MDALKGVVVLKKRREPKVNERVDTLVGKGTKFCGDIHVEGTLRIDGEFDGIIEAQGAVVVGETGKLKAKVKAAACRIAGYFDGEIQTSGRCHITATGTLVGAANVGVLVIEEGANFSGTCQMSANGTGAAPMNSKKGKKDSLSSAVHSEPA